MDNEFYIDYIDEGWMHFDKLEDLIYDVLYRDFGVEPDGNWRQDPEDADTVVGFVDMKLAGTAALVYGPDEKRRQLRQVAVLPQHRCTGLGTALVTELENDARDEGVAEIWLNAREEAFPFYEKLGYEYTGPMFVSELTQIPHRPMRKLLG